MDNTYKTINMCDSCKYYPNTCNARRAQSPILNYVPGKEAYYRNLYKGCRSNVIVCDTYVHIK